MKTMTVVAERCVLPDEQGGVRVGPARVVVDGSRIVEVHEGSELTEAAIDHRLGANQVLAPAWIDGHTHLALHALRGVPTTAAAAGNMVEEVFFSVEQHLTEADVRAFTRVGAMECLLHGTAFVHDHYYHAPAVVDALRDVGLAGIVAPTLQDLGGPARADSARGLAETEELALRTDLREDGISIALGPHATDTVSDALWQKVLELAERRELPIHVHVAQSEAEFGRARAQGARTPVDRLRRAGVLDSQVPLLLVHMLFVDTNDLQALDPRRHMLGACPFSQLQFGFPAPVEEWTAAGIPWLAGTDCVASNDAMNVQKELRLLGGQVGYATTWSKQRAALHYDATVSLARELESSRRERLIEHQRMRDPEFLFGRATHVPGGWHSGIRVGSIEVGALANLAVYDLSHPALWPADEPLRALVFADPAPALDGLMVAGRWRSEPGRGREGLFDRAQAREWCAEATVRREELLRRAGLR